MEVFGFLKESYVNCPQTKYRIEDCRRDSGVICYDLDRKAIINDFLHAVKYKYVSRFIEIVTDVGYLKGTREQTLYATTGFIPLCQLQPGDSLLYLTGEHIEVKEIVEWNVCAPVYALLPEHNDCYFIKGFLGGC